MPPEFDIECPQCGHRYNVHKMIYDRGESFLMFCPLCLHRFERREGKITGANFPISHPQGKGDRLLYSYLRV